MTIKATDTRTHDGHEQTWRPSYQQRIRLNVSGRVATIAAVKWQCRKGCPRCIEQGKGD